MSLITAYSVDIEETGLEAINSPLLEADMACPKLGLKGKQRWNREQCILRVRLNAECTFNCIIGQEIKQELIRTEGAGYLDRDAAFAMREIRDANSTEIERFEAKWGKAFGYKERRDIVKTMLVRVVSASKLSKMEGCSKSYILKYTRLFCKSANKALYQELTGNENSIAALKRHSNEFIRKFPSLKEVKAIIKRNRGNE